MSDAPYEPDALPPQGPDPGVIRGRVSAPAIFLIVVGALNLLAALCAIGVGALLLTKTPAQVHEQAVAQVKAIFSDPDLQKQALDALDKQDPQAVYTQSLLEYFGIGFFWLILGIITIFGGVRMMSLRSYGLAVAGAVIAVIPCISPAGCCLLGEIAGIWALIVLMNADVRAAFR